MEVEFDEFEERSIRFHESLDFLGPVVEGEENLIFHGHEFDGFHLLSSSNDRDGRCFSVVIDLSGFPREIDDFPRRELFGFLSTVNVSVTCRVGVRVVGCSSWEGVGVVEGAGSAFVGRSSEGRGGLLGRGGRAAEGRKGEGKTLGPSWASSDVGRGGGHGREHRLRSSAGRRSSEIKQGRRKRETTRSVRVLKNDEMKSLKLTDDVLNLIHETSYLISPSQQLLQKEL